MARIHPGTDRGVKQAAFVVLLTAYMPAVLVEVGFGTNAAEAAFMSDALRQRQIADAIAGATMEYYEHYERRVTQTGP
jgi:N-acetylmuramoyl-L-alanine amidase